MQKHLRSTFGIAMTAIASLSISLFSPSIANADTTETSCADVTFIGARGTDEPKEAGPFWGFGDSAGLATELLEAKIKISMPDIKLDHKGIDYAAQGANATTSATFISSGGFDNSVKEGVAKTITQLHTTIDECPSTQIVMIGFSQGAEVMHEASNSYFSMHPDRADNLAKVWLISDPTSYHIGTYDAPFGDTYFNQQGEDQYPNNKGLISMMALNQWSPPNVGGPFNSYVKDKVFEICHTDDTICNTPSASPFSWEEADEISAQLSLTQLSIQKVHGTIYKDPNSNIHQDSVNLGSVQIRERVEAMRIQNSSPKMVSTWDTSISGCGTVALPLNGSISAQVNWGDNQFQTVTTANPSHTFSNNTGPKRITVTGTFTGYGRSSYSPTAKCIVAINEWGETGTKSLKNGFSDANNLKIIDRIPSTATDFSYAFASGGKNLDLSKLDVSHVTNMEGTFQNSGFNGDISQWNTSNVTTMKVMFSPSVFKGDIGNWDVSKVTDMSKMFQYTSYNGDIGRWNTSSVQHMDQMFQYTYAINQNLSMWNVTNVTTHASFAEYSPLPLAYWPAFKS